MAEAKHSFVDDYPYLVYAPDAETTYDGNSGGGGGGVPTFEIDAQGEIQMTAGELAELLDNGIAIATMTDQSQTSEFIAMGYLVGLPSDENYTFYMLTITNGSATIVDFVALNARSKPSVSQG